jgi:hypothetical protein
VLSHRTKRHCLSDSHRQTRSRQIEPLVRLPRDEHCYVAQFEQGLLREVEYEVHVFKRRELAFDLRQVWTMWAAACASMPLTDSITKAGALLRSTKPALNRTEQIGAADSELTRFVGPVANEPPSLPLHGKPSLCGFKSRVGNVGAPRLVATADAEAVHRPSQRHPQRDRNRGAVHRSSGICRRLLGVLSTRR